MTQPPLIAESFNKIQAWFFEHIVKVVFRPPADPSAILNFTDKSGVFFPEELRELLIIADGETPTSVGMIGNWRLMSIGEIQVGWGLLTKLAAKGAFIGQEAQTPVYIRNSWWDDGWIPFVTNDSGDYFCLDTNPPEPKRFGQVLLFLRHQPKRPLIAASLRAWFDRIARDLETDLYKYDNENGFNCEAFMWSALQGKHLFDKFNDIQIA